MNASDFAKEKQIDVIEINQFSVVFQMRDGKKLVVRNTIQGINSEVYMFDGKKKPQTIPDIITFNDGKEFQRYFGAKK